MYVDIRTLTSSIERPTAGMESSSLVYFEGTWTEAELARIETAVRKVEDGQAAVLDPSRDAPWVAIAESTGNKNVYFASRRSWTQVLSAQSAEGLAERIREAGLSKKPFVR